MNAFRWSPHYEPIELDDLLQGSHIDGHVKILSDVVPIFDFDFQNLSNKQNGVNANFKQVIFYSRKSLVIIFRTFVLTFHS